MIKSDTDAENIRRSCEKPPRPPMVTMEECLEEYDLDYVTCFNIANGDFETTDKYYKEMDILEVYEKLTIKLAYNYR